MTNLDKVKDRFYKDLDTISAMPREDKLIILSDFNTHVSIDPMLWEGLMGKHGMGNSNGLLLLKSCTVHGLLITNSLPSAH